MRPPAIAAFLIALMVGYHRARLWVPDLTAVIQASGSGSPVFFVPHSDETSALATARRFVERLGHGTIVWLDCRGRRLCGDVDPNRYFGFCNNSYDTEAMRVYREKVFARFGGERLVIALHNNRGCSGTICLDHPYEGARLIGGPGPSDVVIFNGPEDVPSGPRARFSECLVRNRIAQFYETSGAVNDCSMSEAATRLGRFYFNLDTELARGTDNQVEILDRVMACARGVLDPRESR